MRPDFDSISDEEYENKNRVLHSKVQNGESLTNEEVAFFCSCLRLEQLIFYPFCLDEYFCKLFILRNEQIPKVLVPLYRATEKDHIYYIGLVSEWNQTVNKRNHSDQLLQVVSAETREELRNLRKRYSIFSRTFSSRDYQARKFKLLEWSKYRYIIIKEIFELSIKADHYKLYLNGQEIIFDYYSFAHILTRHFAHVMKTYETEKSHFTQDVYHKEVHLKLEEIFKEIDISGVYSKSSIEEINIRYNNNLYKIFNDYEMQGSKKILRLNSFFPIEEKRMLIRLETEFEEKKISDRLSIFLKIGS